MESSIDLELEGTGLTTQQNFAESGGDSTDETVMNVVTINMASEKEDAWGMYVHFDPLPFRICEIDPRKQAARHRIERGCTILSINDVAVTDQNRQYYRELLCEGRPCQMTIKYPDYPINPTKGLKHVEVKDSDEFLEILRPEPPECTPGPGSISVKVSNYPPGTKYISIAFSLICDNCKTIHPYTPLDWSSKTLLGCGSEAIPVTGETETIIDVPNLVGNREFSVKWSYMHLEGNVKWSEWSQHRIIKTEPSEVAPAPLLVTLTSTGLEVKIPRHPDGIKFCTLWIAAEDSPIFTVFDFKTRKLVDPGDGYALLLSKLEDRAYVTVNSVEPETDYYLKHSLREGDGHWTQSSPVVHVKTGKFGTGMKCVKVRRYRDEILLPALKKSNIGSFPPLCIELVASMTAEMMTWEEVKHMMGRYWTFEK